MNPTQSRNGFVYLLIIVAILAIVVYSWRGQAPRPDMMDMSSVASEIRNGNVKQITVNGDDLTVDLKDGKSVTARKEPTSSLVEQLKAFGLTDAQINNFKYTVTRPTDWGTWINILGFMLPALLVAGIIWFMLRQAQGTNNQAMAFGKSRARMITGEQPTVSFEDVAGVEEAKQELAEVVEFLKEPEKFISLGARIPKGVLLVGSPGTGKTLLAKAVSGEAGVPFFSISGSEFVEMFVGVGASRVRDLFDQAKRHSPCIVFVDEIDAVGRHRGAGLGGSHDEREQTLNQILVEMDGFDTDTNVIVVAATNRPDILDPALLRPGRFDRRVVLDRPDLKGREEILKVHVRGKPLGEGVDLMTLAKSTPGFVGADIENMVNEAAILAARRNRKTISMSEFEEAIERVIAGPGRKSRIISQHEKEIIAYHEAGHAVAGYHLPNTDPIHKVTIVARGLAGGYTMALPEEERRLESKARLVENLAFILGGRAAEEIVFGDVTTGASNDLERVTEITRSMVTRYGMSDKLGPMVFGQKDELVFLGKELGEQRDYSEAVAQEIDGEVRHLVSAAHDKAREILTQHRDKLDVIARKLVEVETLDAKQFNALMTGQPMEPPQATPTTPPTTPARPASESPNWQVGTAPAPMPA